MKKFIAIIFAASFAAETFAHQYEEVVDGVTWYYNIVDGYIAEITFKGESPEAFENEYSGALTIPAYLGNHPVYRIGANAFDGCDKLTLLSMTKWVESVGEYAFRGCTELETMVFPFSVTSLGRGIFSGDDKLKWVFFLGDIPPSYCENIFEGQSSEAKTVVYAAGIFPITPEELFGRPVKCCAQIQFDYQRGYLLDEEGHILPYQPISQYKVIPGYPVVVMTAPMPPPMPSVGEGVTTNQSDFDTETYVGTPIYAIPGETIEDLKNASKKGFEFKGWRLDDEFIDGKFTIEKAVAIHAVWSFDYAQLGAELCKVMGEIRENNPKSLYLLDQALKNNGELIKSKDEAAIILEWIVSEIERNPAQKKYLDDLLHTFYSSGDYAYPNGDQADIVIGCLLNDVPMVEWFDYAQDGRTWIDAKWLVHFAANKALKDNLLIGQAFALIDHIADQVEFIDIDKTYLICDLADLTFCDVAYLSQFIDMLEKWGGNISNAVKAALAERITELVLTYPEYINELVRLYELFSDSIPISIKAVLAEKVTDIGVYRPKYLYELSQVYELFGSSIPDARKLEFAARITEVVVERPEYLEGLVYIYKVLGEVIPDARKLEFVERVTAAVLKRPECIEGLAWIYDTLGVSIPSDKKIEYADKLTDSVMNNPGPHELNALLWVYDIFSSALSNDKKCEYVAEFMSLARRNHEWIEFFPAMCYFFGESIPESERLDYVREITEIAIAHPICFDWVGGVYEAFQGSLSLSMRFGLAEKIEAGVTGRLLNEFELDGIECSIEALGINSKPHIRRIRASIEQSEAELGGALDLNFNEVMEWVAYDLAERFASKHGLTRKEYAAAFTAKFGEDYDEAMRCETGKGSANGAPLYVAHDYIAGTDPLDSNDKFTASVTFVDGNPVISYAPKLDDERAALRKYTTWGKASLTDDTWQEVLPGEEADYNFFKVSVEMK